MHARARWPAAGLPGNVVTISPPKGGRLLREA